MNITNKCPRLIRHFVAAVVGPITRATCSSYKTADVRYLLLGHGQPAIQTENVMKALL